MYTNSEILFPHHAIASLATLRDDTWQSLVERVLELPPTHEETLAFMLLMIRLNGCLSCETDSYRALRGCVVCAQQTLRRYKGSDDDLLQLYDDALADVRRLDYEQPQLNIISPQDIPTYRVG